MNRLVDHDQYVYLIFFYITRNMIGWEKFTKQDLRETIASECEGEDDEQVVEDVWNQIQLNIEEE